MMDADAERRPLRARLLCRLFRRQRRPRLTEDIRPFNAESDDGSGRRERRSRTRRSIGRAVAERAN